jgi:hypothetical protein
LRCGVRQVHAFRDRGVGFSAVCRYEDVGVHDDVVVECRPPNRVRLPGLNALEARGTLQQNVRNVWIRNRNLHRIGCHTSATVCNSEGERVDTDGESAQACVGNPGKCLAGFIRPAKRQPVMIGIARAAVQPQELCVVGRDIGPGINDGCMVRVGRETQQDGSRRGDEVRSMIAVQVGSLQQRLLPAILVVS